jgi:hypothetical protein
MKIINREGHTHVVNEAGQEWCLSNEWLGDKEPSSLQAPVIPPVQVVEERAEMTLEDWDKLASGRNRRRLLMGDWIGPTQAEQGLLEIAEYYHTSCEQFNKKICQGRHPETGEVIPLTMSEHRLCDENALKKRFNALRMGTDCGFTEEQVIKAIKDYVRRK